MRHSRKKKGRLKADTDQMPLSAAARPIESVGKCQVNERNQDRDKQLARIWSLATYRGVLKIPCPQGIHISLSFPSIVQFKEDIEKELIYIRKMSNSVGTKG